MIQPWGAEKGLKIWRSSTFSRVSVMFCYLLRNSNPSWKFLILTTKPGKISGFKVHYPYIQDLVLQLRWSKWLLVHRSNIVAWVSKISKSHKNWVTLPSYVLKKCKASPGIRFCFYCCLKSDTDILWTYLTYSCLAQLWFRKIQKRLEVLGILRTGILST